MIDATDPLLDEHLPGWRHRERYAVAIPAPAPVVWAALHAVTGRELLLTRALTAIRALPAPRGSGVDLDRPFVAAFPAAKGFATLHDDPPRALVVGAVMRPWTRSGGHVHGLTAEAFSVFREPGYVRAAMSFELQPLEDGKTCLATETRIEPTSAAAARRFALYWLVIRRGSGLLRRDVLRTVARRARSGDFRPPRDHEHTGLDVMAAQ